MVKGISRQIIVVEAPEPKLFDQAIFILKDDMGEGVTDEALLKEAQRVIRGRDPSSRKRQIWLYGAFWATAGALLTGATRIGKRVKGIRRAAMAPSMPNKKGGKTVIVDCGANAECTPEFLLQFGMVGSAYAKKVLGIANPRIGLLNIGTEDSKGGQLQKDAYALLKQAGEEGLMNFVGNVEARGVPLGDVDVVVCDGFSGNVLIKSIEGTAMFMGSLLKKAFKKSAFSKIGYLLCKSGITELVKMLDYREIGGTQFLGIKKPVIKAHGSSDALAFRNAVKQAMEAARGDFTEQLAEDLAKMKEMAND